uniref:Glutathione S-transferase n=1 Tax=Oryza sativa subsp. japonica TaxID=39947 RepID=Q945X1_ORYSJ|nr:putative glutathione S-transferase OsGSTU7 [Oryza sativa Japonica Group]
MAAGGGGGDELKLLGLWASPYVLRAKFALSFKGLSYENVEEDLHNKSELLLSSNPVHKKVPVLIHNGKPICESQIIVEYVDEAFPDAGESLLPSDPYDRAVARFWAAYINDKFMPAWQKASLGLTEKKKAKAVKQMLAAIENLETAFKELSKGKPFFGGDTAGYLDVTLGAVVGWARAGEVLFGRKLFDATRSPLLAAWMERFVALDAVKAVLPDNAELIEYGKMRMAHYAKLAAALAAANKK